MGWLVDIIKEVRKMTINELDEKVYSMKRKGYGMKRIASILNIDIQIVKNVLNF